MNILVLCTGNSACSILLESFFNTIGEGRVQAYSAGSRPARGVHPQSLKLLAERGHDLKSARSKSWDDFAMPDAPEMDIVVTVCGNAGNEVCPLWPGAPISAHWGVDDPATAEDSDREQAFENVFDVLERRAQFLLALPLETMNADSLQNHLNRIGRI